MHQPDYSSPGDCGEPHLLTSTDHLCGSTANQLLPPALRAPPSVYPTGPSLLPPLGFYSSCASTYGATGFPGSTSTYTHTSWPTNYNSHLNGVPQSFSAPYSTYPPIFAGSYGALPPPLHHPEPVAADSTVTISGFTGRKRPREDADSDIIPAKNCRPTVSLDLPTPPDSSSDRSGTVSPQNYFHHSDILPLQSSVPPPATTGLSPPPVPPMPQNGIHVSLTAKTEELWNLFYSANTEMIVTKNGR